MVMICITHVCELHVQERHTSAQEDSMSPTRMPGMQNGFFGSCRSSTGRCPSLTVHSSSLAQTIFASGVAQALSLLLVSSSEPDVAVMLVNSKAFMERICAASSDRVILHVKVVARDKLEICSRM